MKPNPGQAADDPDNRVVSWIVGVGVAMVPFLYGIFNILSQKALLTSRTGRLNLDGNPAIAMGITLIGFALLIHAKWFWERHPKLQDYSEAFMAIGLIALIGGLGYIGYWLVST